MGAILPVGSGASGEQSISSFYWDDDASDIRKVCVVTREIFLGIGAALLFATYPPVFTTFMLAGLIFHEPIDKGFGHVLRLYNHNWITSIAITIIIALGAIYTFPVSMCVMGLWTGNRIAALSEFTGADGIPEMPHAAPAA